VVTAGDATGDAMTAELKPVAGVHKYLYGSFPPVMDAPMIVLLPGQIVIESLISITGAGNTVTITVSRSVHPLELIAVTTYAVVAAGFAEGVAIDESLKPVVGVHE
jgi:hypothetical protein